MGNDESGSLAELYDRNASLVGQFGDHALRQIEAYINAKPRPEMLVIEQHGPWPEFLFQGTVVRLELEGDAGMWLLEEVSPRGIVMRRVAQAA